MAPCFFIVQRHFSVKQMNPSRLIYFGNWVFVFVLGILNAGCLGVYNYRNV